MKKTDYFIELLTPKQKDDDTLEEKLDIFANRYRKILDTKNIVSIPDNPLGNLHFTAMETIAYLNLELDPERTLLHLNSFHTKKTLESFLWKAYDNDLKYFIVVSGDGGPRLPKLEPKDISSDAKTVNSIELLKYIHNQYGNSFNIGVAFNQYEPEDDEFRKLDKKLEAGAKFVTTQPVIGQDKTIDKLMKYDIPVNLGAWMLSSIDKLYDCIGIEKPKESFRYNPKENLEKLHEMYPKNSVYVSLLPFNKDWSKILPRL